MRKMHVLLIEPDLILAKTYKKALERIGYAVSHEADAQSAINAADLQKPNVVLLEMQLAVHSGAAFLYEFRSYSDWFDVPVVLHTLIPTERLQPFERSLRELGVHDILYKPETTLQSLLSVVVKHVPVSAS